MNATMDELVEKAARAISESREGSVPYDRDDFKERWREHFRTYARAALNAAGLPALLERVEAINVLVQKAEEEGPFIPGEWDGQPVVLVDDVTAILGGQHD